MVGRSGMTFIASRSEHRLRMVRAEPIRDGPGMNRFVVARLFEPDGEAAYRPVAHRLHQCDDGRGIDAARQKRTQGDIRHHLAAQGLPEELLQHRDGVFRASPKRLVASPFRGLGGTPECRDAGFLRQVIQLQDTPRAQLADACVDRIGAGTKLWRIRSARLPRSISGRHAPSARKALISEAKAKLRPIQP